MAGPHQIWKLDLEKGEVSTFAGSGNEARTDGPLLDAGFAQPSGLATDGKILFVADSESNIIRAIDLTTGQVKTVVGGNLFDFGDVDGRGDDVRLQHPLGLFALDGKLLIADTYNHKIKQLDPSERSVKTLFGNGNPGQMDGNSPSFYEPGGLSVAGNRLYVADTNNHAIRIVDLKTKEISTLRIEGLEPPSVSELTATDPDATPNSEEIVLASQRLRANQEGVLSVQVELPAGYHLNPMAPQRYRISVESGAQQLGFKQTATNGNVSEVKETSKKLRLPLRIPFHSGDIGKAELRAQVTLFYCREDNTGTCLIKTLVWRAPIEVVTDTAAPNEIKVQGKVKAD
jgi:hypothetical protein